MEFGTEKTDMVETTGSLLQLPASEVFAIKNGKSDSVYQDVIADSIEADDRRLESGEVKVQSIENPLRVHATSTFVMKNIQTDSAHTENIAVPGEFNEIFKSGPNTAEKVQSTEKRLQMLENVSVEMKKSYLEPSLHPEKIIDSREKIDKPLEVGDEKTESVLSTESRLRLFANVVSEKYDIKSDVAHSVETEILVVLEDLVDKMSEAEKTEKDHSTVSQLKLLANVAFEIKSTKSDLDDSVHPGTSTNTKEAVDKILEYGDEKRKNVESREIPLRMLANTVFLMRNEQPGSTHFVHSEAKHSLLETLSEPSRIETNVPRFVNELCSSKETADGLMMASVDAPVIGQKTVCLNEKDEYKKESVQECKYINDQNEKMESLHELVEGRESTESAMNQLFANVSNKIRCGSGTTDSTLSLVPETKTSQPETPIDSSHTNEDISLFVSLFKSTAEIKKNIPEIQQWLDLCRKDDEESVKETESCSEFKEGRIKYKN